MRCRAITPRNDGWLEVILPDDTLSEVEHMISEEGECVRKKLAGNITRSRELIATDKFEQFLFEVAEKYQEKFDYKPRPTVVTSERQLKITDIWVNYQYQTEFNPSHVHAGVFSFVIWKNIPTDAREQLELPFAQGTTLPCVSCFQFEYTSILGNRKSYNYAMSPQMEGMMLFFPAELHHLVYPFYNNDGVRVTVAGNLAWV